MTLALLLWLAATPSLSVPLTKTTLPNGLVVIVAPDHSVPGVAVDIWYHVGSKDEDRGRTGFAHLFEHLMFMGAKYAPYPTFDTIMEAGGGRNNASTWPDTTHYYESGPSNLLETFLWLESDRMSSLGREMTAEKLETQRKVVLNERRQRLENVPYGKGEDVLPVKLFPAGHPYHWPVIGSAADIQAATLADVKAFFARWYVPSNASLVIAGDVEPVRAQALAARYFGFIPAGTPGTHAFASAVSLSTETKVPLTDAVELSKVTVAWPSPADSAPGSAELDLVGEILSRGKASRLYEQLVHQEGIATEVHAEQDDREIQGVFRIDVLGRPGVTPGRLLAALDDALGRFRREGPTQAEVDGARNPIFTDVARTLEDLVQRAELLNHLQFRDGDPSGIRRELERYGRITPASVRDTVNRVLVPGRVVLTFTPERPGQAAGGSPP